MSMATIYLSAAARHAQDPPWSDVSIRMEIVPEGIVVQAHDASTNVKASRLVGWTEIESDKANPVKRAIDDLRMIAGVG